MDVLSKQTSEAKNFQSHMRNHSFVHTHHSHAMFIRWSCRIFFCCLIPRSNVNVRPNVHKQLHLMARI